MTQSMAGSYQEQQHVPASLPYATPMAREPNIWAAAVLAFVGLGLILLGGCFLIGVMMFHFPSFVNPGIVSIGWTPAIILFVFILYALAGACFVGAFYVLARTVGSLFRLMGGR